MHVQYNNSCRMFDYNVTGHGCMYSNSPHVLLQLLPSYNSSTCLSDECASHPTDCTIFLKASESVLPRRNVYNAMGYE